jgi:hypothetical protein
MDRRRSTRTPDGDLPREVDAERTVREKRRLLKATMNERARRLWAAAEACHRLRRGDRGIAGDEVGDQHGA